MKRLFVIGAVCTLMSACNTSGTPAVAKDGSSASQPKDSASVQNDTIPSNMPVADAATIMARTQVPVLCYHHIQNTKPGAG
ncbi:MAG: hypothetical protein LH478_10860, partial [Chitinophagaceae bacterium]|nr:hypothetical protein [Chitinophagaceae bacterium]